jgi:hypothetical protein
LNFGEDQRWLAAMFSKTTNAEAANCFVATQLPTVIKDSNGSTPGIGPQPLRVARHLPMNARAGMRAEV